MPPWNSAKVKVQLRLSVQRLRTLQQKKEAQAKAARRDIATLVERKKIETARIKVETLINDDIYVELLELLELYCELLIARFGLLDQKLSQSVLREHFIERNEQHKGTGCIREGVCSIIHAAPRTEVKEIHVLRDFLMHKYGREFSIAAVENRDGCVSERVVRKLDLSTPSSELVDAYMMEIAKGYGIVWSLSGQSEKNESTPDDPSVRTEEKPPLASASDAQSDEQSASKDVSQDVPKPSVAQEADVKGTPSESGDDFEALQRRFAALKKR